MNLSNVIESSSNQSWLACATDVQDAVQAQVPDQVEISAEKWEAMQETLFLTSVSGMLKSICEAKAEPLKKQQYMNEAGKWNLVFSKHAINDVKKLYSTGLIENYKDLLETIQINPMSGLSPYSTLMGELKGVYSKKINFHQRLVFELFPVEKTVRILRM